MYLLELSNTQPFMAWTHTIMYWYSSGLFCHSMVSLGSNIIIVVLVTFSVLWFFQKKLQWGPEVCCTWFWLRMLVDHIPSFLVYVPVFWIHYTGLLFPNLFYHSQCPGGGVVCVCTILFWCSALLPFPGLPWMTSMWTLLLDSPSNYVIPIH